MASSDEPLEVTVQVSFLLSVSRMTSPAAFPTPSFGGTSLDPARVALNFKVSAAASLASKAPMRANPVTRHFAQVGLISHPPKLKCSRSASGTRFVIMRLAGK